MGTWTSEGSNTRTISVPKTALNNYVYGDGEHGSSSSSERSFACLKNGTEFQHSFEFETPAWITDPSAVSHANGENNYYNLKFNIAANTGPERTGNIVIKNNGQTLTLNITQAGESTPPPTPTSYPLYINVSTNFFNRFSYMLVNNINNGSLIEIKNSTGKYIKIFDPETDDPNDPIDVSLQPKYVNTNDFTYLTFNNTSTYNLNNIIFKEIIEAQSIEIDGVHMFGWQKVFSQTPIINDNTGIVELPIKNDENLWKNTQPQRNSFLIANDYDDPDYNNVYPTVTIWITNQLKVKTVVTNFDLYIKNESTGGGRKFNYHAHQTARIRTTGNTMVEFPYAEEPDMKLYSNINISAVPSINFTYVIKIKNESLIGSIQDGTISDTYKFYITPVGNPNDQHILTFLKTGTICNFRFDEAMVAFNVLTTGSLVDQGLWYFEDMSTTGSASNTLITVDQYHNSVNDTESFGQHFIGMYLPFEISNTDTWVLSNPENARFLLAFEADLTS